LDVQARARRRPRVRDAIGSARCSRKPRHHRRHRGGRAVSCRSIRRTTYLGSARAMPRTRRWRTTWDAIKGPFEKSATPVQKSAMEVSAPAFGEIAAGCL